jgi:Domain of unknown function (DUF5666)
LKRLLGESYRFIAGGPEEVAGGSDSPLDGTPQHGTRTAPFFPHHRTAGDEIRDAHDNRRPGDRNCVGNLDVLPKNLRMATIRLAIGILLSCGALLGHDPTLHRTKTLTGQVASFTGNGIELKTRTGMVRVKFSAKTKFSDKKNPADKGQLHVGDWAGVIGNEQHNGEFLATEVILGLLAPPSDAKRP